MRKENKMKELPNRKISETILDFGKAIIQELPEPYTKVELEAAIKIVVMVWNAVVLDKSNKNKSFVSQLLELVDNEPFEVKLAIKRLINRKNKKFGDDPRSVGNYWIKEENGELTFGCEALLDLENVEFDAIVH